MKRILITVVSVGMVAALLFGVLPATAAKPQKSGSGKNVIELSNGFPSGHHLNLNIHGKKAEFDCTLMDPGGNSIFIPLNTYTEDENQPDFVTIKYVSNRKKSLENLYAIDPCGMDGEATVQLPYEEQGYYVLARIHGTPNRGNKDDPDGRSNIILMPNKVLEACNDSDPADPDFPNAITCSDPDLEVVLGLIIKDQIYLPLDNQNKFYRFENPGEPKRGKSKAQDITALFTFIGWVISDILDTSTEPSGAGEGVINKYDIPVRDWDGDGGAVTPDNQDVDGDGDWDEDDTIAWLHWELENQDPNNPVVWWYTYEDDPYASDPVWIFNIADLVVTGQEVYNDYAKLLQVRFYPVATTEFKQDPQIIVDKVTDPAGSSQPFTFTLTGPGGFSDSFPLTDADTPYMSVPLKPGEYTLNETAVSGWTTSVNIDDPTGGSTGSGISATIDLSLGDTVVVTFTNTEN